MPRNNIALPNSLKVKCSINLIQYHASEGDLALLINALSSSVNLDFGLFFLSMSTAFALYVFSANIETQSIFVILLAIAVVFFLIGIYLIINWAGNKRKAKYIIEKIKNQRLEFT